MAQFIYTMQNILSMKEKMEEQAKNDYNRKVMRLNREEEQLAEYRKKKATAETELRESMEVELNVQSIRKKNEAIEVFKFYVNHQVQIVKQWQEIVFKAREVLNEAMQERKMHEKLKEKAFNEFMMEENKKEQKEVDELVSYRFGIVRNED